MRTTKHLLTILMALSFVSVKAQEGAIIHIDFIPDTCHTFTRPLGQLFAFDIDGNGTDDFAFRSYQGDMHSTWVYLDAFDDWMVAYEMPSHPYPDMVQLDTLQYYHTIAVFPNFCKSSRDYIVRKLAFRRTVGDILYYAWVRIYGGWNVDDGRAYACVEEYAYCTVANYPLRWGQTELNTSVDENSEGVFAVYPNPAKQSVTLIGQQIAEARLYSVTGQLVATKPGNGTESLTMDVSGLPSGLYFVAAIGEDGSRSVLKMVKE